MDISYSNRKDSLKERRVCRGGEKDYLMKFEIYNIEILLIINYIIGRRYCLNMH